MDRVMLNNQQDEEVKAKQAASKKPLTIEASYE
jgi:hypothetical protein